MCCNREFHFLAFFSYKFIFFLKKGIIFFKKVTFFYFTFFAFFTFFFSVSTYVKKGVKNYSKKGGYDCLLRLYWDLQKTLIMVKYLKLDLEYPGFFIKTVYIALPTILFMIGVNFYFLKNFVGVEELSFLPSFLYFLTL